MAFVEKSGLDPCGSVDILSSGVCSPPARINTQDWATMLVGAAFLKASWTRTLALKNKILGEIVLVFLSRIQTLSDSTERFVKVKTSHYSAEMKSIN